MSRFSKMVWILLALLGAVSGCNSEAPDPQTRASGQTLLSVPTGTLRLDTRGLPPEAVNVLERIARGGPFPFRKDGTAFQNRERRLPVRPRSYYREYTVPTPGERTRGARRIVTGGNPPEVYYYSPDHYRSFRKIPEQP